jgi:hypothetical protein
MIKDLLIMLGVLAVIIAALYLVKFKPVELELWSPHLAEKQYEGAKEGRWGERIISLEESACELHRVRYRGIYYIANTCGGLVIEPLTRR